jgi:hypothetical protein
MPLHTEEIPLPDNLNQNQHNTQYKKRSELSQPCIPPSSPSLGYNIISNTFIMIWKNFEQQNWRQLVNDLDNVSHSS